ncbi:hypothetical protein [Psychrobacter aestuarii]|uniref:VanZ-like domain-containing protein n=1 Tax=Psychrobacter aestuarii TaxID=556327 RepID=A0ABN0W446_9GAMM|nr:hypothetical protein [Psychrobacter aestuarii]
MPLEFYILKTNIVDMTGLERDALHIYIGIMVYVALMWLLRRFLPHYKAALLALAGVTVVTLIGEYLDLRQQVDFGLEMRFGDSIHDIINTCFWPYALYALGRWTTLLQTPRRYR